VIKIAYRGPALNYQIRKTTTNNKTGDSYAITIPRIVAKQFEECFFRMCVSGTNIIFESGCKLSVNDIEVNKDKKVFQAGGLISFSK
jgi:hypothetical protein